MRLRTLLPIHALLLISCGPVENGLYLEVSSDIPELDGLSVTVLSPTGALITDQRLSRPDADALKLPGRIRLELSGRNEALRFLVWGFRGDVRSAFGAVASNQETRSDLRVTLSSPPPDQDGDLIPNAWDGCPTIADPLQEDADADGVTDACESAVPSCPGNIPINPDFENDLAGWSGVDGEPTRVAPGRGGTRGAARLCRTGEGLKTFTLEEWPPALRNPVAGRKYRVEAWVRAETEPGQRLVPVIREVGEGGTYAGASPDSGAVILGGDWQRVSTEYTVAGDNSEELLVEFASTNAPVGACFDLDEVCFVDVQE